jgi:uncharacterized protein YndB with AHSA1/START domain
VSDSGTLLWRGEVVEAEPERHLSFTFDVAGSGEKPMSVRFGSTAPASAIRPHEPVVRTQIMKCLDDDLSTPAPNNCYQEQKMRISVETNVKAPIDKAWQAYTTPDDIKKWNAASDDWHTTAAAVDLREGGTFSSRMEAKDGSIGFDFAGTYTKIVTHERIEYQFGDRKAEVLFTPGSHGVAVRITFDSEPTHSIEQQRSGWQAILDNFKCHVEAKPKSS